MTDEPERCWTHPDYIETVARLRRELEQQQLRNANLAEENTLLRNRYNALKEKITE